MSTSAEAWLSHFPIRDQNMLTAWFRRAVQQGALTPDEVLVKVTVLLGQKLAWSVEPSSRLLVQETLVALRCGRQGALAFAAQILAEEGRS